MDIWQAPGAHNNSSVVINDFNLVRVRAVPAKADPPLVIDADAPLATAITPQSLEPIAGRYRQRPQVDCRIEHAKLPASQPLDILRQPSGEPALPYGLGFLVTETLDHGGMLMGTISNVNREYEKVRVVTHINTLLRPLRRESPGIRTLVKDPGNRWRFPRTRSFSLRVDTP